MTSDFGDVWIKTACGWRPACMLSQTAMADNSATLQIVEKQPVSALDSNSVSDAPVREGEKGTRRHVTPMLRQPFVRVQYKQNIYGLTEVLTMLNFAEAIQDVRMFSYIHQVVSLLTCHHFGSLAGSGQNQLIGIAKHAMDYALETGNNIHMMEDLLKHIEQAILTVTKRSSSPRLKKALDEIQSLLNTLESFEPEQRENDGKPTIDNLPMEIIIHIINMLPNYKDIVNLGLTNQRLQEVSSGTKIWKDLVHFHYNKSQINPFKSDEGTDWNTTFYELHKKHGEKESYGCILVQCDLCRCVFWEALGHECLCEGDVKPQFRQIMPKTFLEIFTSAVVNTTRRKTKFSYGVDY